MGILRAARVGRVEEDRAGQVAGWTPDHVGGGRCKNTIAQPTHYSKGVIKCEVGPENDFILKLGYC